MCRFSWRIVLRAGSKCNIHTVDQLIDSRTGCTPEEVILHACLSHAFAPVRVIQVLVCGVNRAGLYAIHLLT